MKNLLSITLALLVAFSCEPTKKKTSDSTELNELDVTEDKIYTTDKEIAARIEYLVKMSDARTSEDRLQDQEYRKKYEDAIVIESLAVGAPGWTNVNFTLEAFQSMVDERYWDKGMTMMNTTASNGSEGFADTYPRISGVRAYVENNKDRYVLIESVDDIYRAKKEGKFGIAVNFQSSDPLDSVVGNVQKYYDEGLRQLNFTYNQANYWANGSNDNAEGTEDNGLTAAGEELVRAMNAAGVVVDASHSSDQTAIEAAAITTKPMVLSHSNPRALRDIPRNSRDEAIKAVAETGGCICVNYLGGFLNEEGDASPEAIAKHVQYIRELVGWEATCGGSDYVHNYAQALDPIIRNQDKYPISSGYGTVTEMGFPEDIWGVARILEVQYNWTEEEIRGFLGENLLRVYKANWK